MQSIPSRWKLLGYAAAMLAVPTCAWAQEPAARPAFSFSPSAIKSIIFPSKRENDVSQGVQAQTRNAPLPERASPTQIEGAGAAEANRVQPPAAKASSLRPARVGTAGRASGSGTQPAAEGNPRAHRAAARPSPSRPQRSSRRSDATAASTSATGLQRAAVVPLSEDPLASPLKSSTKRSSSSLEAYRHALDRAVVMPEVVESEEPVTAQYEEEVILNPQPSSPPAENFAPIVSAKDRPRPAGLRKKTPPQASAPSNHSSGAARQSDPSASVVAHYPSTSTPAGPIAQTGATKQKRSQVETASAVAARLGVPEFEQAKPETQTLALRKIEPEDEVNTESREPALEEKSKDEQKDEAKEEARGSTVEVAIAENGDDQPADSSPQPTPRKRFAFPQKLLGRKTAAAASSRPSGPLEATPNSKAPTLLSVPRQKADVAAAPTAERLAELLVKPAFVVSAREQQTR